MNECTAEEMKRRRDRYVEDGKSALQEAMVFLEQYSEVWYEGNHKVWLELIQKAQRNLHIASDLQESMSNIT